MGGPSAERDISVATGTAVSRVLREAGFRVAEILLDRNLPAVLKRKKIRFVFIALHGCLGEDGSVQGLLEVLGIPYSGSGVLASALSMNKISTKCIWERHHLPVPHWWEYLCSGETGYTDHPYSAKDQRFFLSKLPLVVKPVSQGSAIGVSIARTPREFRKAVQVAGAYSRSILIEKYIEGKEITVGILGDKALEVIEIQPRGPFYDYASKYDVGGSNHIIPATIGRKKRTQAQALALQAYRFVHGAVMARIDMFIDRQGRFFLLEANTIPGMTATSLLPDAARYEGIDFGELVQRIIALSLKKSR